MLELYTALDQLGGFVLRLLAPHLGLAPTFFDDKVDHGNSVLRLLHYPPLPASAQPLGTSSQGGAVRAAAHEDINLITFLVSAEGPGLEILIRRGEWLPAPSGRGVIVCNVGDMMQRLTNQCLAIHAPPGRQSAPAVWRRVALLDAISYTRTANCRSRLYRPASRMNARIATPRRSPPMRT